MCTLSTSTDSQYVKWLNTGCTREIGNYKNNNNLFKLKNNTNIY